MVNLREACRELSKVTAFLSKVKGGYVSPSHKETTCDRNNEELIIVVFSLSVTIHVGNL